MRSRLTWPKTIEYLGYLLTGAAGVTLVFDPSPSGIVGFLSGVVASIGGWWSGRQLSGLQERARGRTIDAEGRTTIVDWLRKTTRPDVPLIIHAVSEPEPFAFARQLRDILLGAGWAVSPVDAGPAIGAPLVGLVIWTPKGEGTPAATLHLKHALEAAGLTVRFAETPSVKDGHFVLAVGVKP